MKSWDKKQALIFSLGGSLIIPEQTVDTLFLKKFRAFILFLLKSGHKIVIVTGGGQTSKKYNLAATKISQVKNIDLDWLGIAATKLNAELLRVIFSQQAYSQVLDNPNQKIRTNKKLIIASGWKPGCSSDLDAVLWANNFQARLLINLTDIDFVYEKDPDQYPKARPIKQINWADFRKIIGNQWSPRLSRPFGPPAARLAQKNKLKVLILNGRKLDNLKNYLKGKNFKGTIIE